MIIDPVLHYNGRHISAGVLIILFSLSMILCVESPFTDLIGKLETFPALPKPHNWYNPGVELYQISDRKKLAKYFRQDLPLHAYSLGDLDDLYWPKTIYYGKSVGEKISHISLLYRGEGLPVLLMLGPQEYFSDEYYRSLSPLLPDSFYAHLSLGLDSLFRQDYEIKDQGEHYKMSLIKSGELEYTDPKILVQLTESHHSELENLFQISYPDNAYDPQMLTTGKYYGIRAGDKLVCVAGIHVYSSRYRVAALGNITTHPEFRNRGYARMATSSLIRDLLREVDYIGLNVKSNNLPAIHLYQSLGFEIASKYGEYSLKKRI